MKTTILSWAMALLPGGGLVAALGRVVAGVKQFITWAVEGVAVVFEHPVTFIVCLGFAVAGAIGAGKYASHLVAYWQEQAHISDQRLTTYKALQGKAQTDDERLAKVARAAGEAAAKAVVQQQKQELVEIAKAAGGPGAGDLAAQPASVAGVRDAGAVPKPVKRSAGAPKCDAGVLGSIQALWWSCK